MVRQKRRFVTIHATQHVVGVALVGGRGSRLEPATDYIAKPLLEVGGVCALDFALANLENSQIPRSFLLAAYDQNAIQAYVNGLTLTGNVLTLSPDHKPAEQGTLSREKFHGTANAVWQHLEKILETGAKYVIIVPGDMISKIDYRLPLAHAVESGAEVTVLTLRVQASLAAGRYGVFTLDDQGRAVDFHEKPSDPVADTEGKSTVSAGAYIFEAEYLRKALKDDAADPHSQKDFGKNVIPAAVRDDEVLVQTYDLAQMDIPGERRTKTGPVWLDIGEFDQLFTFLDIITSAVPDIDLHNPQWPFPVRKSAGRSTKYPRMGNDPQFPQPPWWPTPQELGEISGYLVGSDCHLDPHRICDSVAIHDGVTVARYCWISRSIIGHHAKIGYGVRMVNTYVMPGVHIPAGIRIGYDEEEDRRNNIAVIGFARVVTEKSFR